MVENLLYIAKVFLDCLHESNFTDEEREQVVNTVRNIIFVLLIELRQEQGRM